MDQPGLSKRYNINDIKNHFYLEREQYHFRMKKDYDLYAGNRYKIQVDPPAWYHSPIPPGTISYWKPKENYKYHHFQAGSLEVATTCALVDQYACVCRRPYVCELLGQLCLCHAFHAEMTRWERKLMYISAAGNMEVVERFPVCGAHHFLLGVMLTELAHYREEKNTHHTFEVLKEPKYY
jgi:hypothetical protein